MQEAWLRLSRADRSDVDNLGGWLTTVVGRVCLDMLRSRRPAGRSRSEVRLPDPIVTPATGADPEHQALLADSVGLALLVVLDTLTPAERLAFVLHDMFAVPFERDRRRCSDRSPAAARQLASRARRRVQGRGAGARSPTSAGSAQVVDAFLAAARAATSTALVAVLDPDVVLRADGGAPGPASGGRAAPRPSPDRASTFAPAGARTSGRRWSTGGRAWSPRPTASRSSVMAFTVADDRIVAIDILADPRPAGRAQPALRGLTAVTFPARRPSWQQERRPRRRTS